MLRVKSNWGRPVRSGFVFALVASLIGCIAWLMLPCRESSAELEAPRATDRQVMLVVTSLLREQHLSKHPLDDEISQRCLTAFLDMLDHMKIHFYQSDVDEFMKYRNELDNAAIRGDMTFAYKVFERFLKRVDERAALVERVAGRPVRF